MFSFFKDDKPKTANMAKERLKVIVAHERSLRSQPDYLPAMQHDILTVIQKYVNVGAEDVNIELESEGQVSVLELNVTLPE